MFVKVLVFILNVSVLCMGSLKPDDPGYEYYPKLEGWLKVHEYKVDFRTAKANCHSEGALLAGPWNSEFKRTITKLQTTKYSSLSTLYSGAALTKGSTGIPMEPTENKRCNVFLADGSMDKVNCRTRLPYVCYASKSSCSNDSYKYNNVTGQCYKLHTKEMTVPNAKRACEEEGGYLAKINSHEEEKVLSALKFTPDSLTYIDKDDGRTDTDRHLTSDGYDDYNCGAAPHMFICESNFINKGSNFID